MKKIINCRITSSAPGRATIKLRWHWLASDRKRSQSRQSRTCSSLKAAKPKKASISISINIGTVLPPHLQPSRLRRGERRLVRRRHSEEGNSGGHEAASNCDQRWRRQQNNGTQVGGLIFSGRRLSCGPRRVRNCSTAGPAERRASKATAESKVKRITVNGKWPETKIVASASLHFRGTRTLSRGTRDELLGASQTWHRVIGRNLQSACVMVVVALTVRRMQRASSERPPSPPRSVGKAKARDAGYALAAGPRWNS